MSLGVMARCNRKSLWEVKLYIVGMEHRIYSNGMSPLVSYADTAFGHDPPAEFLSLCAAELNGCLEHVYDLGTGTVRFDKLVLLGDHYDHDEDVGLQWRSTPERVWFELGTLIRHQHICMVVSHERNRNSPVARLSHTSLRWSTESRTHCHWA